MTVYEEIEYAIDMMEALLDANQADAHVKAYYDYQDVLWIEMILAKYQD